MLTYSVILYLLVQQISDFGLLHMQVFPAHNAAAIASQGKVHARENVLGEIDCLGGLGDPALLHDELLRHRSKNCNESITWTTVQTSQTSQT